MPQNKSAEPAALLDTKDLAARLKSPSPATLERWRSIGQGPKFIKVGRQVLYRESDVEQWLDEQTRSHTNESAAR